MASWIDVEQARSRPGLRLALTAGVPGPWGEAAKGLFHVKGIPFERVRQQGGADNQALFEWTGHRNAPVAIYADEPPRVAWAEILWLAERLGPEPALLPCDPGDRALMFGLIHELAGEQGLGWSRRLMLFRNLLGEADEPPEALRPMLGRMLAQYRYSRAAGEAAAVRVEEILGLFSERLAAQRSLGRAYLLGDRPSAVDIYWAAFAGILAPLPHDLCAMSEAMRTQYTVAAPDPLAALDPALLELRDRIYRDLLETPIQL